jgi:hypothetical protein
MVKYNKDNETYMILNEQVPPKYYINDKVNYSY